MDTNADTGTKQLFVDAVARQRAGNLAEAEQICRNILKIENRHAGALALLGILHANRRDFPEAARLLKSSVDIDDRQPTALAALGYALHRLDRHAEAVSACEQAIALRPEDAAHRYRSSALLKLNRLDEALSSANEAVALSPKNAKNHHARATALKKLGRHADALASYDRMIELKPDDVSAHIGRGQMLAVLNRFDDAAASYEKTIELEPNNAEAYKCRGDLCSRSDRLEEAIGFYDKAIALRPDYASAYSMRANALRSLKRHDEARASIERAIEIDPRLSDTIARLLFLHSTDRLIGLDYGVSPAVRWGEAPQAQLATIIGAGDPHYAATIATFMRYAPQFQAIARDARDGTAPYWANPWLPPMDAISLYGFLASRNPRRYVEIGSGMSTKFARRAITDHHLRTEVISIDPAPRSEIDAICDRVIRSPLESADLVIFDSLTSDDMVFCDNSHRSFQNSDVTVFFLEVLPRLKGGPLIGVHDIFLPYDYPSQWLRRFYNEQYLLACWLLAHDRLHIELPVHHVASTPELKRAFAPVLSDPMLSEGGGGFWFSLL